MPIVWDDDKRPSGIVWDDEKPKHESVDPMKAAAIAAGEWVDQKAAGLRGAVRDYVPFGGKIVSAIDKIDQARGVATPTEESLAANAPAMAALRKDNPTATFLGGAAPDLMMMNPVAMGISAAINPGTLGERAMNAGLSFGAGKAGQFVGGKIADKMGQRAAERAAVQPAGLTARDETARELMDAGLKLPPDQVNPTMLNRFATGLAGKANTQQGMAMANEPKLVEMAKAELGIPAHLPLTKEAITMSRTVAGKAYEELKKFGTFRADPEYHAGLNGLTTEYRALVQEFPEMRNATVDGLVKMVSRDEFKSAPAVELVKRLRKDARTNFKAFDNPERQQVAQVQRGIADTVEDMMDRNLVASGNEGFLDVFRKARTMIAKSHTIQDAFEESTGKIVASKVKGRHLTGNLALIAKAHEAFPKSVQNVNTPMPGMNPLDFVAGLIGGQAGGIGAGLGIPVVRPLVRAGITSDAFQKTLRGGGKEADLFALLSKDPEKAKRLGGLLGLSGLQAYQ